MADMIVIPKKVGPLQGAQTREHTAGGPGNLGDSIHIAGDADVEQANASVAGTAKGRGIVVAIQGGKTSFVAGDALTVAISGPVSGFAGMTPQTTLYQSNTAGALADLAGTVSHKMGYAESASVVVLAPEA